MENPDKQFLNRDSPGEQARQVLNRWANLIDKAANYGTHFLTVLNESTTGLHDLPPILLFRYGLEMLDGISIVMRQSAIPVALPLLRTLIETTWQLEYMLKEDQVRRGKAYRVQHLYEQIDLAEKADPKTDKGKQFAATMAKDTSMENYQLPNIDSTAKVDSIKKSLAEPDLDEVNKEWERIRAGKSGRIWWYNLFGGPKSIEVLAGNIERQGWYENLYRTFSGSTHGSKGEKGYYQPLRYPAMAHDAGALAIGIALHLFKVLIDHYAKRDKESLAQWYLQEVYEEFTALKNIKFQETGS